MARLIVMGNEKGGSGKSTTAMHLITALVRNGHAVGAVMYKSLPYDAAADFQPVTMLATMPLVVVAGTKAPYGDLQGLIAAAKQSPGKLNFASVGVGSTQQFAGVLRGRGPRPGELVGDGQDAGDERVLVPRVEPQHVLADALGLLGLVEQPVAVGLLQGGRDALAGEVFEVEHDTPSPVVPGVETPGYYR